MFKSSEEFSMFQGVTVISTTDKTRSVDAVSSEPCIFEESNGREMFTGPVSPKVD
jgi:hypothetical protein